MIALKIKIRKARKNAAEAIENITISSWIETYSDILPNEYFKNMKSKRENAIKITQKRIEQFYVIENEHKILGFARITEFDDDVAEINSIYLDVTEKRNGYGTMLLNYIFLNNDYKKYIVTVFEQNGSNEFYKKMNGKLIDKTFIKLGDKAYPVNVYEIIL